MLSLSPDELFYGPKFKVGDSVMVPGFRSAHRVIEVWPGKKNRYLLGYGIGDGIYRVNLVAEESKLQVPKTSE